MPARRHNPSTAATIGWMAAAVLVGGALGYSAGLFLCRRGPGPNESLAPSGNEPIIIDITGSRCTMGQWSFACTNIVARLGEESRDRPIILLTTTGSHGTVEQALADLEAAGFSDVTVQGD